MMLASGAPALAASSRTLQIDGTICRMNRPVERMIIESDSGSRIRLILDRAAIAFKGHTYDRVDLRPGDRVHIVAVRGRGAYLVARSLDLTMRVDEALVDTIFRSHHTVLGRFTEADRKSDSFTLQMPERRFVHVDAAKASDPDGGRVPVRVFRRGDLLEVRGSWIARDRLRASTITVMTDREPSFCQNEARRGEMNADTTEREASEKAFLDHH